MSHLWESFLTNQGRMAHKWTHYFPAYENHFSRYVNRPVVFWEIGVGEGGSLPLWKKYLGPYAQIVGLDIVDKSAFEEDQIAIRTGDQSDPAVLQRLLDEFGPPDVVLDDGSHVMTHQEATFRYVYPRMARDGVYAVEDLHTSYWSEYGGGLRQPGLLRTWPSPAQTCSHDWRSEPRLTAAMAAVMSSGGVLASVLRFLR